MGTVIINEFELMPAPQPAEPGTNTGGQGTPAEPVAGTSLAQSVERMLRRQVQRTLRTWAH